MMSNTENPFDRLSQQISNLQKTVDALTENSNQKNEKHNTKVWFDLDELCQYLPDRPAKSTLYLKLSQGKIPGHKNGKKWFFYKNDVDEWLKKGRLKTVLEIEEDSERYLSKS